MAHNQLGSTFDAEGNTTAAKAAYRRAIDSGHLDHAPWALIHLASLLDKHRVIQLALGDFSSRPSTTVTPRCPRWR
ncbi:hypothetical protein GCM10022247_72690 [Allokutzneria multivorans]|uniref:Tetratricopeptide repeat protein n=1 Tax=Allokutzneria multivorans TaxID=1142134 RepID=A0ABP7U5M0_9PSEU